MVSACIPKRRLTASQLQLTLGTNRTESEWLNTFASWGTPEVELEIGVEEVGEKIANSHDDESEIIEEAEDFTPLSPIESGRRTGIFEVLPSLSFESAASTDTATASAMDGLAGGEEVTVLGKIQRLQNGMAKMKAAWSKPFSDIEASYLMVIRDITSKLHDRGLKRVDKELESNTKGVEALEVAQGAQFQGVEQKLRVSANTVLSAKED